MGRKDGKPKGRMSSYSYFVQTCREEQKKKHPGDFVVFAEFAKKCAEKWRDMSPKEKKRFEEMEELDKKRYNKEMANYQPPEGTVVKGKKRTKYPNAPKRALSAFFIFCSDERPKVRAIHNDWSVGEVAKDLGKKWEKVTDRSDFVRRAQLEKKRYEEEMVRYRKGGAGAVASPNKAPARSPAKKAKVVVQEEEEDDDDEEDEDMSPKEKKRFEEMEELDKKRYNKEMANYQPPEGTVVKGKKRTKYPNAPKRALSAFFIFCSDERPKVRAIHNDWSVGEVAKDLGKKWEKVTDRSDFVRRAQLEKKRYEEEMVRYRKGGAGAVASPNKAPARSPAKKAKVVVQEEEEDDDDEEDEDMSPKEKKRFEEMEELDKKRYNKEMANYQPPEGTVVKGKKRTKYPNAPKRALSAFFIFCSDEGPKVRAIHNDWSVGEMAKDLGKKWEKVTDRSDFVRRAQLEKKRYEEEMVRYRKGGAGAVASPNKAPSRSPAKKAKVVVQEEEEDDDDEEDEDDEEEEEDDEDDDE